MSLSGAPTSAVLASAGVAQVEPPAQALEHKYIVLDLFRFIAASLVMVYHLNIGMNLGIERAFPGILTFKYFVDFFFVLSGFVIAINYADRLKDGPSYARFLGRRIARIYPLHVATLLIFAVAGNYALAKGISFDRPEYFSFRWLSENLLLVHAWGFVPHRTFNGPSWSISAEMFVYLLFPLFALLAARLSWVINAVLIVLLVALMATVRTLAGLEPWHIATNQAGMLRAVPTFFAGVLIARAVLNGAVISAPVARRGALLSLLLATAVIVLNLPAELVIASFVPVVLFTAFAERSTEFSAGFKRIAGALGEASYAVYMLQMGAVAFGTILARKTVGLDGGTGLMVAFATYLATLVLAIPVFHWFENPARRALQRLFERRVPA